MSWPRPYVCSDKKWEKEEKIRLYARLKLSPEDAWHIWKTERYTGYKVLIKVGKMTLGG